MSGYRRHLTRESIAGDNQDTVSNFHWELVVDQWPLAVYYPGDRVFNTRLIDVTPPSDISPQINEDRIHNHAVKQFGNIDRSGSLSGNFQDFVDQSILAIFIDWQRKIEDEETKVGLPKSQLVMNATLLQLDRQMRAIKEWRMRTGLLSNFNTGESFGGDNTSGGKISFSIDFEHIVCNPLNT